MEKNYTINCKWVGDVNNENIKEMANVMVWNCCPCTYKDEDVTAVASAPLGKVFISIGEKRYDYTLNSKRVSAKMGKEIIDCILKAVAEYKAENKVENKAEKKQVVSDALFNYTVDDILNGENTAMLNEKVSNLVYGKNITYVYNTYPYYMEDGTAYMTLDGGVCNAMTWGQLVSPMCKELQTIDESGQFDHSTHDLTEVFIEEVEIIVDGDDVIVSMELGS